MADPRFSGKLIAVIGDEVGRFFVFFSRGNVGPSQGLNSLASHGGGALVARGFLALGSGRIRSMRCSLIFGSSCLPLSFFFW